MVEVTTEGLYLTSGLIAKGNSETHLLLRSSVPKTGRGRSRHDALRRLWPDMVGNLRRRCAALQMSVFDEFIASGG